MIGIIGGTAIGQSFDILGKGKTVEVDTPFGKPSAPFIVATVEGVEVALLARHGVGHVTPPSAVNYRANIWGLKKLGCTHVIATTAVGSLREEIHPKHLVLPDQVIDKTHRRLGTFFDDCAVHVELAAPFCAQLRSTYKDASQGLATTIHDGATYVCMEGPAFSTRAESEWHRAIGAHLIGMTVMPEAKLAREAELCYAPIAMPTDFDCWKPHPGTLSSHALLQELMGNFAEATKSAFALVKLALPKVAALAQTPCACRSALDHALFSDVKKLSPEVKARHELLLGRHFQKA
jgi:5'-methylthioadenosine phosphorylase